MESWSFRDLLLISAVSSVLVFVLTSGVFLPCTSPSLVSKAPSAHAAVPVLCVAKEAGESCLHMPLSGEQMFLEEVEQLHPRLSPRRGWRAAGAQWQGGGVPLEEDPPALVPLDTARPDISLGCVEQ